MCKYKYNIMTRSKFYIYGNVYDLNINVLYKE